MGRAWRGREGGQSYDMNYALDYGGATNEANRNDEMFAP